MLSQQPTLNLNAWLQDQLSKGNVLTATFSKEGTVVRMQIKAPEANEEQA
jgi:hypothetical protein